MRPCKLSACIDVSKMPSLGLRISLFILMTIGYILFLIALVERFVVVPSSESAPTFKYNQPGSIPSSPPTKPYPPFIETELQEPFGILPQKPIFSSSSSAEGIEICATDGECYTYYPGIVPRRPTLGNIEPAMTRSTQHVVRSVSSWACDVLRRGFRPRGLRREQKREQKREQQWKRLGVMETK